MDESEDARGIREDAEDEVPAGMVAAPNFGDAPTQGPDEPLRLLAGEAGDGGVHGTYSYRSRKYQISLV